MSYDDPFTERAQRWTGRMPLVIIGFGLAHAWLARHTGRSDTISYLDMSDAYAEQGFEALVNGHWSPLYPWLLSLARRILKPSPYWEFATVHLVDLAIYLAAFACFRFFLTELIGCGRARGGTSLPEWAWRLLGYALFVWSSLSLIQRFPAGTPDLLVAAAVYLAAGLVLRMRAGRDGWPQYALLGAVLGLGYLAKTAMFPLGLVFAVVSAVAAGSLRRAAPRALLAVAVMLAVSAPLIVALSRRYGRLTFGESGRLNYAWMVNDIRKFMHWQGGPPGNGTPRHPTRRVSETPAVYEFGSPIGGAYPPWTDPAYWYEGLELRFDAREQARALLSNAKILFNLFVRQGGLFVGWLALSWVSRRRGRDLAGGWPLVAPALAAFGMYSLVYMEWRYIGAFVVLLWAGLFLGVRATEDPEAARWAGRLAAAIAVVLVAEVAALTVHEYYDKARPASSHPHWRAAEGLRRAGVGPGERVCTIGWGSDAYWARLARVRIVCEVPRGEEASFWEADEAARRRALEAMAAAGARAVVATGVPPRAAPGWQKLGDTPHLVRPLGAAGSATTP